MTYIHARATSTTNDTHLQRLHLLLAVDDLDPLQQRQLRAAQGAQRGVSARGRGIGLWDRLYGLTGSKQRTVLFKGKKRREGRRDVTPPSTTPPPLLRNVGYVVRATTYRT